MRQPLGDIRTPRAFLYDPNLMRNAKVLYLYLQDKGEGRDSFPLSFEETAADLQISKKTIQRAMKNLIEEEYITREDHYHGKGKHEAYLSFLYEAKG